MRVTLTSTTKIVEVDGVRTRVWEGHTAAGIVCHAYIALIAADLDSDVSEFEADLVEHAAPSPDVAAFPSRLRTL